MTPNAKDRTLELHNVSRSFGATVALDDVSLTIASGEIICLVGQSGCGKSTLLRMIAGVDTVDGGRILLNDQEISGPAHFVEPEDRKIGFVFQDYALFPHLTVEQNIQFGLKRRSKQEAAARTADVIAHIGIAHLKGRYPHMLSGGEQQRVALARALAPQPDILLMDEPFSNLDRGLREKVRDETLSLLRGLGTTVIMVTHDPEEALSAGDRVVLMKAGKIVQAGSGYDLHDRPVSPYAAEFFCAFNRISGVYRNGHVETAIGRFAQVLDARDGTPSMLYIRPQGITVSRGPGDFSGEVKNRTFLGEVEQLAIAVKGLEQPLQVRTMHRLPSGIETVGLTVLPDSWLVFPAA
ncbi:iron ABC transporter ATP-binding protein [Rhizobium sp. Root73]|uniref:ABC transporter ATP-binding protein n=1 Tax=unclassified Rhizobium TaxID=2613769 RepID=UPI00072C16A7|nr:MULTISPECIES: ABC transporter ATP-binding protein [unclassified Rhizobium]KQY16392.1 iron ABC transporter ATP-binding protein [Rhizobium sp. Root1334]KRC12767.1 iron ABC transporter ATP-binding protein [Rhizobium sp. Root73]